MPPLELDVLFLDNHLLVVNKPAGVLAQGDITGDLDLLTLGKAYLKETFDKPGNVFLGLVHRLDRPVSGVMVYARTSKAAARLSEQFRERTPDKRYVALVEGACSGRGTRVDYLAKADRHVRVVSQTHPEGKRAEMEWEALGTHRGQSLVAVQLKTGRQHQIRVQLAALGHPIVGDFRYGATQELDGRNMGLHCYHLGVEHPTQRVPCAWQAPPPPTWGPAFRDALQALLEG